MKMLLAVDGSEYTRRMLEYIATHRDLFDLSHDYTALNVVAPVPPRVTGFVDRQTLDSYYTEHAEQVLAPVRERAAQNGWKLKAMHAVGPVAELIARTANEGGYDMLVMGSHGHEPMAQLVLGSVTSRVLAHCTKPVLIVR
ncbi:MAG TPA: universal stress protein [Albitalea sp.]|uniref:universal stress protein n=1 Tax=Piscinibacter sp. TaxID=1903157 RepID=UPI002ED5651E